jgi:GH24 family phage-related lysozyme (muramidase)
MERSLELYTDGRLYEYEGDQAVKVTETQGQVTALLQALKFSTATTLRVAPPAQQSPDVPTPRGSRRINDGGFKLLTTFEGCKLKAYDDGGEVWTIGYGHTHGVFEGMTITQTQAEQFLHEDLEQFESYVEEAVQVDLNDDQFSALVCFCFNVGPGTDGFGTSTLLKKLNAGDYQGAVGQFPVWNKVKGEPWLGLTRRRLAEQALFLSKPWEFAQAYEGPVNIPVANTTAQASGARSLKLTDPRMEGNDVQQLQLALQKAGFNLDADGIFGKATEAAVRQFQEQKGLEVDGIAGLATFSALA